MNFLMLFEIIFYSYGIFPASYIYLTYTTRSNDDYQAIDRIPYSLSNIFVHFKINILRDLHTFPHCLTRVQP